ncbi:MAG: TRAP transporter substrate-binding protein DctP, partial [Deltaproteobacteria bacterium]|nr:TRAP transporter substrate-binding protein DctP [Deltaproteobacteria bacterium]
MKANKTTALLFGFMFFLTLIVAPELSAGAKILKYSDHDPPSGPRYESLVVWFKEIEKRSNGRVKVKAFFGGAMGKSRESLKMVSEGTVDMAFVYPGHFPKQLIANNIFPLFPQGPSKWENVKWVYDRIFSEIPEFSKELEKENQKVLYITSALPASMCATYPVSSLDDLKGKKWRAASKYHLAYLKSVGAIPVSVPWSDCYMALQTGTIDGVLTDYDGMHMTKLDEAAPNVFVSRSLWFGTPFLHNINLDTWNSLSKADQEAILSAADYVSREVFGKHFKAEFDAIVESQKKMGVKVNFWSDSDLAKWNNNPVIPKLRKEWIKEARSVGLTNADELMERVKKI